MTLGLAFAWLVGFLVTVGVILWRAMRQSRSWNDLTTPSPLVQRDLRRPSMEDVDDSVSVRRDRVAGRGSEGHGPNVAADPPAKAPSVPPNAA